jgi:HK97 family phage major capsid protein
LRRGNLAASGSLSLLNEMSVGSDPDGGYLVDPDTTGRIATLIRERSPLRSLASIQEISTDALEGDVDAGDATAFWVAETEDRPETESPPIGKWRIEANELYAMPSTTQKVLDDPRIDAGAWLGLKLADRFARAEAAAFVVGDGVKKPRGFMTYDAGVPSESRWDVIERVASGDANLVTPDSLIDVVYALKPTYRQGAAWGMTATTTAIVRKLKSSDGAFLWTDALAAGQPATLLGFPVVEMPELDEVGAGKEPIVFGNFLSAYQIVDRFGIRILRDPYTTKGRVKFYSTMRVGGGVICFEALKILKVATS